jgi:uncharacterized protein (TIGR03437 family)
LQLYKTVLATLLFCGLASGANCQKDLSPGLDGLWPFALVKPNTHIIIRSGGHTIEYVFYNDSLIEVVVDYQVVDLGSPLNNWEATNDAQALINSMCGPGFVPSPASSQFKNRASPAASVTQVAAAGHVSEDIAVSDFNGDGVPDSAALTANGISVSLNGPNGTTLSRTLYPVAGLGVARSIVAADFNRDGLPDLAVTQGTFPTAANPFPPGNLVVLPGRRDGTFGSPVQFPVGPIYNTYLASGDFNGDGFMDLAFTHTVAKGSGEVAVLLGKGDGTFHAPVGYPVGPGPFTLIAADFTGDGKLDLAALDAFGVTNSVWVLPGRGDGTFQPAVSSPSLTKEGFLGYADLNHDGNLDLVIADQPASAMEVMLGNGNGTFQAGKQYLIGAHPISIAIVPLHDESTALLTADNASNNLFVALVGGDGVVHSPELQSLGVAPSAVAAVDLNGDHQPDLVVTDPAAGQIYVKLANGKGKFAGAVAYHAGQEPTALAIADLNGDGKADVVAADDNGLDVLLGTGDGTLGGATTFSAPGTLTSVAVADFNRDGKPDVAAAQAGGVALFLGKGNGTLQTARTIDVPNALGAVAGDFNGDGTPDLAVSVGPADFQTPGSIAVLLGKGDGTFQSARYLALPGPLVSTALAVADLNGDGRLDLVTGVVGGSRSAIAILLGIGDGTFQSPVQVSSNTAPPSISIADLDGDGKPDLLLADCCGLVEASFMLGNGDGTFQPESQFPSGPNPQSIAVADFNGDGRPDLAIIGQVTEANPGRGTLAFWFNAFGSLSPGTNAATVVSSANAAGGAVVAPGSLATVYGTDLAQGTPGAASGPLPVAFGGTTVTLSDAAGKQWPAPLLYVSATQVNFLVPAGVATGSARVTIVSGDGTQSSAPVQVAPVAPGLFTLNAENLPAAIAIKYAADGSQQVEQVYLVNNAGAFLASPIDLGSESDQLYLLLFGTGIQAAQTSGVKVTVGATDLPVTFAGPQGFFVGLDQVNVLLPHALQGSGDVTLRLTAAGLPANTVRLTIK